MDRSFRSVLPVALVAVVVIITIVVGVYYAKAGSVERVLATGEPGQGNDTSSSSSSSGLQFSPAVIAGLSVGGLLLVGSVLLVFGWLRRRRQRLAAARALRDAPDILEDVHSQLDEASLGHLRTTLDQIKADIGAEGMTAGAIRRARVALASCKADIGRNENMGHRFFMERRARLPSDHFRVRFALYRRIIDELDGALEIHDKSRVLLDHLIGLARRLHESWSDDFTVARNRREFRRTLRETSDSLRDNRYAAEPTFVHVRTVLGGIEMGLRNEATWEVWTPIFIILANIRLMAQKFRGNDAALLSSMAGYAEKQTSSNREAVEATFAGRGPVGFANDEAHTLAQYLELHASSLMMPFGTDYFFRRFYRALDMAPRGTPAMVNRELATF